MKILKYIRAYDIIYLVKGGLDYMPKLIMKITLIIAMFVYILAISPIVLQNDTFFDIALGKEYTENGIHEIDNFSIHEGLSYHAQHLIVNLIIYNIHNTFNFLGLYVFEIILTCVIALLFYLVNCRFTKNKALSYILVYLELLMFSPFISLRAQMFSTIIFLIEILLINKLLYGNLSKKHNNYVIVILTLLPVLLINLHSGVVAFYYIILGVYLTNLLKIHIIRIENDSNIDSKLLQKLFIPLLLSLPLLLLNPFGVEGITYMPKTLGNSFINANIVEFQPFSIKATSGLIISIYFAIHFATLILSDRKIKIYELLFFIGTMFMTLLSLRHFIFYIITTLVLIPHIENVTYKAKKWLYNGLNEKGPKVMTATTYIVTAFVIFTISISCLSEKTYEFIPKDEYPVGAVEFIKENIGYDKGIFNEYAWGSYLMLNNIKVFIDSRCDLYTKEYNKDVTVAEDYMKTLNCRVDYDETVDKYKIKYFLISEERPLFVMLSKDNNYEIIYQDSTASIFRKK